MRAGVLLYHVAQTTTGDTVFALISRPDRLLHAFVSYSPETCLYGDDYHPHRGRAKNLYIPQRSDISISAHWLIPIAASRLHASSGQSVGQYSLSRDRTAAIFRVRR